MRSPKPVRALATPKAFAASLFSITSNKTLYERQISLYLVSIASFFLFI